MSRKLGWGILATGWIAELFTQDLLDADLRVAAVGSRSRDKAEDFAARFKIPSAYGSYRDLVSDPDVDVVYIATPHPQHAECATLALEAGKHVLVEKAFTLNAAEARRVVDLARERNLVILEAMWTRFLPHMIRIRQIIASGGLGEIISISADHRQALPSDPTHRLNDLRLGGGALLDLGIYPVSFAIDLLGPPVSLTALARFKDTGADAEVVATMRHANGAMSTSTCASDYAGPNIATIFGSRARLEIPAIWFTPSPFRVIDHHGNIVEDYTDTVSGRGMQFQAFEMEALVRSGDTSTLMPPEQSVEIMKTLDAIRRQIGLVYPQEQT